MSFITERTILSSQRSKQMIYLSMDESLRQYKNESSSFRATKIFLSHKHDERDRLEGTISLLKSFGVEVYVDWLDEGMPKTTSGQTAKKIKEKIRENHKFILLATEGAINSKWCNWELGLGDAAKYIDNIAILPIVTESQNFSGNEYLEIYPYIFRLDNYQYFKGSYYNSGIYVVFPNDRVVLLSEWLRR